MFKEHKPDWLRRFDQEDMLASGVRIGLSAAGPIGAFIGEFITQFVPQQRVDRLHDFVEELHERLGAVEERFRARVESSPQYANLVEEVSLAAVRTPSDERRQDLTEVLKTGLSKTDAELIGHHALLRLLEGLNEPQVLILMSYGSFKQYFGSPEVSAFLAKHPGVFVEPPGGDAHPDERRAWSLYNHYLDELIARGLLRDTEGIAKSGPPRKLEITELGKMLLTATGRPVLA